MAKRINEQILLLLLRDGRWKKWVARLLSTVCPPQLVQAKVGFARAGTLLLRATVFSSVLRFLFSDDSLIRARSPSPLVPWSMARRTDFDFRNVKRGFQSERNCLCYHQYDHHLHFG